jgi:hypothetical protein
MVAVTNSSRLGTCGSGADCDGLLSPSGGVLAAGLGGGALALGWLSLGPLAGAPSGGSGVGPGIALPVGGGHTAAGPGAEFWPTVAVVLVDSVFICMPL